MERIERTPLRFRFALIVLLIVIVAAGAMMRINNLERHSLGHIEVYVPNIPLPERLSNDPHPRLTLIDSITGPIAGEPHPPGFYVAMYFWTKVFGISKFALRFPSALVGILSIILIYGVASAEHNRLTGVLAAGMLAFNGLAIFWAQSARMYSFGLFFALLSTLSLLRIVNNRGSPWANRLVYMLSSLAGVSFVLFYWPVFVLQVVWILLLALTGRAGMRPLFSWQLIALSLSAPLWSIVAFQTRYRSPAIFDSSWIDNLSDFLQFGILLEPDLFSPDPWTLNAPLPFMQLIIYLLAAAAVLLTFYGLTPKRNRSEFPEPDWDVRSWMVWGATIVSVSIIGGFLFLVQLIDRNQTGIVSLTLGIPLLLFAIERTGRRYWEPITSRARFFRENQIVAVLVNSPSLLLAFVPVVTIIVLGLYAPRSILIYVPFLLIAISKGISKAIQTKARLWPVIVSFLLIIHLASSLHYRGRIHDPVNYEGIAEQLAQNVTGDDLIFVQVFWPFPPLFYYLDVNEYRFVGHDYQSALAESPVSRVWVIRLDDLPDGEEMESALGPYELVGSLTDLRIRADLYQPDDG